MPEVHARLLQHESADLGARRAPGIIWRTDGGYLVDSCCKWGRPPTTLTDTTHDHGDEQDDANEQAAFALSLACLFDERFGV